MLPVVSIICCTYNHEPFIRQSLDGFMMQKTDFSFEVLIHDDASTDNTAEIIREYELKYPDKIFPIYATENKYSKGIDIFSQILLPKAKGKYIAICEGDDYWTDPLKLQKQVIVLESSENFVLCSTNYQTYNQQSCIYGSSLAIKELTKYNIENMIAGDWYFHPLTVIFRRSSLDLSNLNSYKNIVDVVLFYEILKGKGIGVFLPDVTAVYRLHSNGVWSQINLNAKRQQEFDVRLDLCSVENNIDTAILLLSQFQRPISRAWMLKNLGLMGNLFVIFTRFFGMPFAFKVLSSKFFLNRSFSRYEMEQVLRQNKRN